MGLRKKLVKSRKINKLHLKGKIGIEGKTRQNAMNKQTFDTKGKIGIEEKTRQNSENEQTVDLNGKSGIEVLPAILRTIGGGPNGYRDFL